MLRNIQMVLLLFVLTVSGIAENANLMNNGGAEESVSFNQHILSTVIDEHKQMKPTDKIPPGWGVYSSGGRGVWGVTDKEAHSGRNSVFFTINKLHKWGRGGKGALLGVLLGESNGRDSLQEISVDANTQYQFSFWFKGDISCLNLMVLCWNNSGKRRIIYKVNQLRENGRPMKLIDKLQPGKCWKYCEGNFTTFPDTSGIALLIGIENPIFLAPGQTVYVDDAKIYKNEFDHWKNK